MRVGFVAFSNIKYSPYINAYTKIFDKHPQIEYEIIFLNRYGSLNEVDQKGAVPIKWFGKNANAANKVIKLMNFFWFATKCKQIIKRKNYDFIICLTTVPAVLLSGFLVKHYKGRYIVDIRDYTHENNKIFWRKECDVIRYSACNVISSPGFTNFLPENEYILMHNYNGECKDENNKSGYAFEKKTELPLRISYIGSVSYEAQCKKIIDLVIKDERFEMHFWGNESSNKNISRYIRQLANSRVVFNGPFEPSEKKEIYRASDLVFNCYGNSTPLVKYAISNKYYDGAFYKKPLLVSPHTAMEDVSKGYAFALDLSSAQDLNELFHWYNSINAQSYSLYGQEVIEKTIGENKIAEEKILSAILAQ